MQHKKFKDIKLRKLFFKKEFFLILNSFLFKNLLSNPKISSNLKKFIVLNFFAQRSQKKSTQIVNRCVVSNRGRGNLRVFKVSRLILREFMGMGVIPGYRKASR